jgi:hypothetical protein
MIGEKSRVLAQNLPGNCRETCILNIPDKAHPGVIPFRRFL